MLRKTSPPIEPRRFDAPTTTTAAAPKNGRKAAATATWSRSSTRARNRSVGATHRVEAQVTGALGEPPEELDEGARVSTRRRSQPKCRAVAENHVHGDGRHKRTRRRVRGTHRSQGSPARRGAASAPPRNGA